MRILTVIGTRPEAVKLAPVVRALTERGVENIVCSTGQHRDMLDQMFALFDIEPDIDLDIMRPNQSPTLVAARVLAGLDPILTDVRPDWVLVQGDTTTVMAASIAAHYGRVRVGHVEAGLRTYDRRNPFPEETNRVIADHVSDMHFAPTQGARLNLLREGISASSIHVTGNTVIDALLDVAARPSPSELNNGLIPPGKRIILVTAHRRENHGAPLRNICAALRQLAQRQDVYIIYAVHRNPNVWDVVHAQLQNTPHIRLIPPLDYLPMVHLMKRSTLILTDSGGIQEEAPTLGVPVLVLRETTERPEAVEAGVVSLVGTDSERIVAHASALLEDQAAYQAMAQGLNPYGDGQAAARIVEILLHDGRLPAHLAQWGS